MGGYVIPGDLVGLNCRLEVLVRLKILSLVMNLFLGPKLIRRGYYSGKSLARFGGPLDACLWLSIIGRVQTKPLNAQQSAEGVRNVRLIASIC